MGDKTISPTTHGLEDDRLSLLEEPHIAALTRFVEEAKVELGPDFGMPYFDPLDGGVNARLLWVLETPGPRAVGTNFVSRNNPDETARNTGRILAGAGIDRRDTVLWNVVPWNLSTRSRNKNATVADARRGIPYLLRLIRFLPRLEVVILCGAAAKLAARAIHSSTKVRIFQTYHPSGRSFSNPYQRDHILGTVADAARLLNENSIRNATDGGYAREASAVQPAGAPRPARSVYTVEGHVARTNAECQAIFQQLREFILGLHPEVKEKAVKILVGYRAKKNFAEIHFLLDRLKIHLRPKDYDDPEQRVEHLLDPGFTMDRRVYIASEKEMAYVRSLIAQSYEDVAFD